MSRHLLDEGWNKATTSATLTHVKYIMEKMNLSFLETQVILSWLQCDLNYKLSNVAIANGIRELSDIPPDDTMRGYG